MRTRDMATDEPKGGAFLALPDTFAIAWACTDQRLKVTAPFYRCR